MARSCSSGPVWEFLLSADFWVGLAALAGGLAVANVVWQRRRRQAAARRAMKLELEKQKQDRSLL